MRVDSHPAFREVSGPQKNAKERLSNMLKSACFPRDDAVSFVSTNLEMLLVRLLLTIVATFVL
jgi:hypothetical protein